MFLSHVASLDSKTRSISMSRKFENRMNSTTDLGSASKGVASDALLGTNVASESLVALGTN